MITKNFIVALVVTYIFILNSMSSIAEKVCDLPECIWITESNANVSYEVFVGIFQTNLHVQQHTELEVFYVDCSCSGQWHLKSFSLVQQVDTKIFLII